MHGHIHIWDLLIGLKRTGHLWIDSKHRRPMNGLKKTGQLGIDSKTQDTYAGTQKDRTPRDGLKKTEYFCMDSN